MPSIERIQGLLERLGTYPPVYIAVELILIWIVVYAIVKFLEGTRAAGALKGLLIIVIVVALLSRLLGGAEIFQRLSVLYDKFLALIAVALIVIFQPELRRALVRLGEAPFFRATPKDVLYIADQVAEACKYLSRQKFGALVVIERQVGLRGAVEGGTILDARLTARLLQSIFFPGSALHDLAVIIKGKTVHAAGVQLPLADPEEMPDPELGSRHRAAVGISREADALVVVVSEETGYIRIAERGRLSPPLTADELANELRARLGRLPPASSRPAPGARLGDSVHHAALGDTMHGSSGDTLAGTNVADALHGSATDASLEPGSGAPIGASVKDAPERR